MRYTLDELRTMDVAALEDLLADDIANSEEVDVDLVVSVLDILQEKDPSGFPQYTKEEMDEKWQEILEAVAAENSRP